MTAGRGRWTSLAVVAACAIVTACTGPGGESRGGPAHPNIILVSIDTLRADRLGLHGYDRHPTSPTLDALARDGIVHDAHIASSSWTTPSHMSLLTSLHPSAHGVTRAFRNLPDGESVPAGFVRLGASHVTLAEALAGAGYRTAAFTGGITVAPDIGFDQGFDQYASTMYKLAGAQMQPMLDWLKAEPDRPSFLFWHSFEVHAPYTQGRFLPPSWGGLRLDLARLTQMITDEPTDSFRTPFSELTNELLERHSALNAEVASDLYDGGVASADRWLARLLEFLFENDLYDSTMIVVTSDHGEELADHDPELFNDWHGHSAYEELLRVPLVVKLPGSARAGHRVGAVTSGIDVMPTVLDVAGVEGPEAMQGRSLVDLWEGRDLPARTAFSESTFYAEEIKSVRGPRYKLIFEMGEDTVAEHGRAYVPPAPDRRLLFDLASDPGEHQDLLEAPSAHAEEIAAGLEQDLRSYVARTPGEVEEIELDDEAVERLKAMGYIQ